MALTFTPSGPATSGAGGRIAKGLLTIGAYATNGVVYDPSLFGLSIVNSISFGEETSGYNFEHDKTNKKVKVYSGGVSAFTPAGTNANESSHTHAVLLDTGASAAGSSHNHTFTGTAPTAAENLATPVFSGTGQSSSGQVITTTDNQTMTLNQCAGMWFISATHGPYLIESNTAVTGAPAVLTIYGTAPTTDAGTYKIITGMTPVGSNAAESTHTHGPGTLADAASGAGSAHTHAFTGTAVAGAAGSEVANSTDLSAVVVEVTVTGI